jgi:hypothetical protein
MIEIESKFAIGAEIVIKDLYPHRSRGCGKSMTFVLRTISC